MKYFIHKRKIYIPYDEYYYISHDGDIYSTYIKGIMKHYITSDGYHRVDIHGKHMMVHRLVYMTWKGKIKPGCQINHIDDNKDNNNYNNLYMGTQKENIEDCIRNGHRVGNIKGIIVFDKSINRIIKFKRILDLIQYSGHSYLSGSLNKITSKKWFKKRFEIIKVGKGVEAIESI